VQAGATVEAHLATGLVDPLAVGNRFRAMARCFALCLVANSVGETLRRSTHFRIDLDQPHLHFDVDLCAALE